MGNLERGIGGRDAPDLALDPAQAGMDAVLEPALGHELHADADAEERAALPDDRVLQRLDHAGQGVESGLAVGEGADAGQHHALGAAHVLGAAGDRDLGPDAGLARRALERLGRRAQIARAVIDDRDGHTGATASRLARSK